MLGLGFRIQGFDWGSGKKVYTKVHRVQVGSFERSSCDLLFFCVGLLLPYTICI